MELWAHQKEAIQRAQDKNNFALLFDPGTGKSATIINILRQKYTLNNSLLKTLILCPTVVCENWKKEWEKFSKVPQDKVLVLLGSGKQRKELLEKTDAKIVVTNYQALLMEDLYEAFKNWNAVCIVADESHRIKTPSAKTTKRAIQLSENCKYKYILTGTPILQSLMDFYSQFKFLDGGETFGGNFNYFRNHYFYNANAHAPSHVTWPDWRVRPNAEKEVKEKVFKKSMYVEKSKCLDLPPLLRKEISVELSPKQAKHYLEMEKEFVTYMNGEACVANIALTKGLRLMQITSGFMNLEEGKVVRFEENPRLSALSDLLEDIAPYHKVIVWACFKENYEMIKEVSEQYGYVELHGETKDRQQVIDLFQNDDKVRILIGNAAACGIGVNLTAASYAIYYSRNFSLEADIQSEARNYRGGSEIHQKITRIDLVAKGTIDEDVLNALKNKQSISDIILKGILNDKIKTNKR